MGVFLGFTKGDTRSLSLLIWFFEVMYAVGFGVKGLFYRSLLKEGP